MDRLICGSRHEALVFRGKLAGTLRRLKDTEADKGEGGDGVGWLPTSKLLRLFSRASCVAIADGRVPPSSCSLLQRLEMHICCAVGAVWQGHFGASWQCHR